jgi:transposase
MERKKSHAPYPPTFREEAVRLVQAGARSIAQAARDLGIHPETLRLWVRQTEINEGRRAGLATAERDELTRLRRENRILKEEREILKKAAAFFAAESATR